MIKKTEDILMGVEILGGNELEDVGIREKPGRMGIWRVIEAGGFFFCAATTTASLTFLFFIKWSFDRFACTQEWQNRWKCGAAQPISQFLNPRQVCMYETAGLSG